MIDLVERLRMVSNMIHLGERISWGQETTLMDEAAAEIERLRGILAARTISDLTPEEYRHWRLEVENEAIAQREQNKAET